MNEEILGLSQATEQERQQARDRIAELDQSLTDRRRKLARAFHALYCETPVSDGWDFSSPEAALATIEQDGIPDEVIYWLFRLPSEIVNRRRSELSKNLAASFETSVD